MIVLKILGMLLWLIVIPFGIGLLMMSAGKKSNVQNQVCSIGTTMLWGYILQFTLLEIVGIPVMLCSVYHGYSNFYKIYAPLLVIAATVGIWISVRRHVIQNMAKVSWKQFRKEVGDTWESRISLLLFLVVVAFQLYMAFTRASFDGDDAYYGVQSLMAQQTDTLYRINPNNGRSMPLDARHALALFPIWEAFLGTMCGIHATIVAHSIVPLVLIPLSYLIYYEIAKLLFSDKKALLPLFLIFMAVWQMFGNVSIYTTETFFLTRTWQGKSFAGNFVIPAVIWLFLCLFPDKREGERTPMWKNWIILGALNLAAGASSSLAVLLSCLMTVGFGVLFAIKERKLRNLIYACISCSLGGVYVLLYLAL